MTVIIETGDPRDPAATKLLQASHALMQELFDPQANHFLSIDALCEPNIRFFVARVDGDIRGCGALALKDGYGEIKSMYVDPDTRGLGLAAQLIEGIEAAAKAENLAVLKLETGDLLHDAHRLYERQGFTRCGPFGDYIEEPSSIYMTKKL
ncbi:MAG: GNAT family N-acetyltransferase [Paracoccaceae bacterium]